MGGHVPRLATMICNHRVWGSIPQLSNKYLDKIYLFGIKFFSIFVLKTMAKLICNYELVFTEREDSYFRCYLVDNTFIEISFWSFYEYMTNTDENLRQFVLKFDEWEQLTTELIEFDYDFKTKLNLYLKQFSDEVLEDFCFPIEEE
jgi:hypothetical protein